jgi:hypothetical protein
MSNYFESKEHSIQPEYATIRGTSALFGLSRTELFDLIATKKIVSVHAVKPTSKRKGLRLVELASVRRYLQSLLPTE